MSPLQQVQDPTSLSLLRDIIEPEAIPSWPLAPGWWVMLGVAFALLCLLALRALNKFRLNAYRRAALRELAALNGEDLAPLPALLKRTALGGFPRTQVASLSGEPWLRFLDSSGNTTEFTSGPGRALIALAYETEALPPEQCAALLHCAKQWINGHERGAA